MRGLGNHIVMVPLSPLRASSGRGKPRRFTPIIRTHAKPVTWLKTRIVRGYAQVRVSETGICYRPSVIQYGRTFQFITSITHASWFPHVPNRVHAVYWRNTLSPHLVHEAVKNVRHTARNELIFLTVHTHCQGQDVDGCD